MGASSSGIWTARQVRDGRNDADYPRNYSVEYLVIAGGGGGGIIKFISFIIYSYFYSEFEQFGGIVRHRRIL